MFKIHILNVQNTYIKCQIFHGFLAENKKLLSKKKLFLELVSNLFLERIPKKKK